MAWQDEMTIILRTLISDLDATLYTDDTLETTLVVAGRLASTKLTFPNTYRCDVVSVAITPDPTLTATRDDWFIDLACLKAACIISHGSAIIAANRAIAVRDGSSSIDLRGILQGKLKLLEKGWCAGYEDAELEYLSSQSSGMGGAAIMTPFRTLIYGGFGLTIGVPGQSSRDSDGFA